MITDSKYLESIFSEDAQSSLFSEESNETDTDNKQDDKEDDVEPVDGEDESVASLARYGGIMVRKSITRATRDKRLGGMYYKDGKLYNYHEDSEMDNSISTKPSSSGANEDGSTTTKSNQASDPAMDKAINDALKESTTYKKLIRLTESSDDSYIYAVSYEEYLENCMDNEAAIKHFIYHGLNESTQLQPIQEAERLQDTVAKKWDGFLQFTNGIVDRFWKAMDSIVLSRKSYLDKYERIIKDKKPREDIEVEYVGNYESGTDRIANTHLPSFDYNAHGEYLRGEGYKPILERTLGGNGFSYNEDDKSNLAKAFKNYFIGMNNLEDEPPKKLKLASMNMNKLFTWCYNSQDLTNIIKRDRAALNQSRNALINAVNKEAQKKGENPNTQQTSQTAERTETPASGQNQNNNATPGESTGGNTQNANAAYIDTSTHWIGLSEAEENGGNNANQDSQQHSAGDTAMNVTSSDPDKRDENGNIKNDATADPKKTTEQDINNIVNKWINLNRCFLTGKLTAVQTISRDYMKLITQHVASYGGSTPDKEKNDKENQAKNGQPAEEKPAEGQQQGNQQQNAEAK